MRPVAVYSALRVGLFLAALLLLRLLGVSGLLSVVVALLVSMLLSFLVLRRQRDAVTRALMDRSATRSSRPRRPRRGLSGRLEEDAAAEDAAVAGAHDGRPPTGASAARDGRRPPAARDRSAGPPSGGDR